MTKTTFVDNKAMIFLKMCLYENKEEKQVELENVRGPPFPDVKMYPERTIDVNQPRKTYAAFSTPAPAHMLTTEVKFPEFRKNLPDPSTFPNIQDQQYLESGGQKTHPRLRKVCQVRDHYILSSPRASTQFSRIPATMKRNLSPEVPSTTWSPLSGEPVV